MRAMYRPEMTHAGLDPTIAVIAVDEYRNRREMNIAEERPLTIYLDRHEIVTLMTLGTHPELLCLGYLRNQGIVKDLHDIRSIHVDWSVNAAAVATHSESVAWREQLGSRIVTTGCGQGTVFSNIMERLSEIRLKPYQLKQSVIYGLLRELGRSNDVYRNAGAVHGCALCQAEQVLCFIEDVGRHNAVDAIAGKMWLQDAAGADKIFYTTGRLTSEMVIKVAQMGIPILLSRSGITQMGLKLARDLGVTLLARANGKHFLIYNGEENIVFDEKLPPKLEVANLAGRPDQTAAS
ncbi:MAG: sulfurtransferase FdhD [Gammaproteobacteria bacterium]|jgi:FdhD protein|nr:MAG: sulfurtransferase FdhD [Gammaproteobacteria bacterium]